MKDPSKYARQGIMELAPYVAGKPIEEVEAEYGVTNVAKLASNENPLGVSPKAIAAMQKEMANCNLYPEGSSPRLRKKLAARLGVADSQIFLGTGGDEILTLLGHAFVSEGDEVIMGSPSFFTYVTSTLVMGGKLVKIPVTENELALDTEAILAAITPKTKLIYFCNPNNPTGTIIGKEETAAFMSKVPDHCVVVFDEAYFELVQDPSYPNGLDYVKQEANVVVLRTFSKVYGLAGLRVGYAVMPDHLAAVFGRVMPPFPVNRLAQVAAEAALDDTEYLQAVIKNNNEGRAYLNSEFDKLGMKYASSNGNYIFVDTGLPIVEVNEKLLKRGIIIRPGSQWGFPTHMRVSIGSMENNQKLIAALQDIQKEYK